MADKAEARVAVADPRGIHGRNAVCIWRAVARHRSDVVITVRGEALRPAGMGVTSWVVTLPLLKVGAGETVTISAEGPDAAKAVCAVTRALEAKHAPNVKAGGIVQVAAEMARLLNPELTPARRPRKNRPPVSPEWFGAGGVQAETRAERERRRLEKLERDMRRWDDLAGGNQWTF